MNIDEFNNFDEKICFLEQIISKRKTHANVFFSKVIEGGRENKQILHIILPKSIHTIKKIKIQDSPECYYAISCSIDLIKDPVSKIFIDDNNIHHTGYKLLEYDDSYIGSFIENIIFIYNYIKDKPDYFIYVFDEEFDRTLFLKELEDLIYNEKPDFFI